MEKILILARSNSPFKTVRRDYDFIIENLIKLGYSVDIYDPKQRILMNINKKQSTDYSLFPKFTYRLKLNIFLNFFSLIYFGIKNKRAYNIVQINYLREEYLVIPNIIAGLGDTLIISLFGSDINKRSFIKNHFTKIFELAEKIIVTNLKFGQIADSYVKNSSISTKIYQLMLPQDHFKFYREFTYENKIESKKTLKLPVNKTIVAIGTNSTENEQHEKILNEITQLKNIDNYFFIFNLSNRYNKLNEREKKLKNLIEKTLPSNAYIIYTEFLSYEEMALVRHATDIFVNLRLIDQLAASMLESNLAFSLVITGNWLPYKDYTDSVYTILLQNSNELTNALNVFELNKLELIDKLKSNKETVLSKYDNNVLNDWLSMYQKISQ